MDMSGARDRRVGHLPAPSPGPREGGPSREGCSHGWLTPRRAPVCFGSIPGDCEPGGWACTPLVLHNCTRKRGSWGEGAGARKGLRGAICRARASCCPAAQGPFLGRGFSSHFVGVKTEGQWPWCYGRTDGQGQLRERETRRPRSCQTQPRHHPTSGENILGGETGTESPGTKG